MIQERETTDPPVSTGTRKVYLNEYNVMMDGAAYLPIVSGMLQGYALTFEDVRRGYAFQPFSFARGNPDEIVDRHVNPEVAAFSASMWNEQLSLQVAERVKKRYPDCLIVFGGPQVPHHAEDYHRQYPFIDVTVRGEGEQPFAGILRRNLESRDFTDIPGASFVDRKTGRWVRNDREVEMKKDLDVYPSPYLLGLFDPLIRDYPDLAFQAIIETNRGCPFLCTFCYWGQGGLSTKYRFFSIDRVRKMVEWCGRNEIRYIFNADSNFGMHRRDREIAEHLVATKERFGYPEKFRTCYGKNTDDKIYEIASLLHRYEMEKGITLARQSNDAETLKNIKRQNIKLSTYRNLHKRFDAEGVPVYVELILGLPGETYETWLDGLNDVLLHAGSRHQLFIYFCQIYPNTELAHPEYREKFGIESVRVPLQEIHGAVRDDGLPDEYEDLIVATKSMPLSDWKRMTMLNWWLQVLHGLKMGFFVMAWLTDRFGLKFTDWIEDLVERGGDAGRFPVIAGEMETFRRDMEWILAGKGRGRILREFGDIYWDEEEASFLRLSDHREDFFREMETLVLEFLSARKLDFDAGEVREVLAYQKIRTPGHESPESQSMRFDRNIPGYFEHVFDETPLPITHEPQELRLVDAADFGGDRREFAKKALLWGRKSGALLRKVEWKGLREPLGSTSGQG